MAATKRLQNKCKKCGYTWYPRGKNISLKCPSCGSSEVGFAGTGLGVIVLIVIAAAIFGGNKKEAPADALSASPAVTEITSPVDHSTTQFEPVPEQAAEQTNTSDVPDDSIQVNEKVQTSPVTSECVSNNEGKSDECSTTECIGGASDSIHCESKRALKNELY